MIGRQTKILIIEDSPSQAAVIADIVGQSGFAPVVYHSVKGGVVRILEKETPAAVLLDLNLLDEDGNQVADGFQICREIKRSLQNVPVVVVSAEDESEATEWALHQGADAFIQKPFAVSDLLEVLNRVLGIS
jgi:DNA-binding response OmpR family regulator